MDEEEELILNQHKYLWKGKEISKDVQKNVSLKDSQVWVRYIYDSVERISQWYQLFNKNKSGSSNVSLCGGDMRNYSMSYDVAYTNKTQDAPREMFLILWSLDYDTPNVTSQDPNNNVAQTSLQQLLRDP